MSNMPMAIAHSPAKNNNIILIGNSSKKSEKDIVPTSSF